MIRRTNLVNFGPEGLSFVETTLFILTIPSFNRHLLCVRDLLLAFVVDSAILEPNFNFSH